MVANAIKFSRSQDRVEVTVRSSAEGVEVEVADRGPGVPEPLKEGFFQKFGTVAARKERARRGFGLGLYLVELVASAHRGRVEVKDRDGGGTLFKLLLPGHDG
jgi:K+-sensing histidine kinase KdpD